MQLIALMDGARDALVLAADLRQHPEDGFGEGFVLAKTSHGEFVTWRVTQNCEASSTWLAWSGNYFGFTPDAEANARRDYDERRGVSRERTRS